MLYIFCKKEDVTYNLGKKQFVQGKNVWKRKINFCVFFLHMQHNHISKNLPGSTYCPASWCSEHHTSMFSIFFSFCSPLNSFDISVHSSAFTEALLPVSNNLESGISIYFVRKGWTCKRLLALITPRYRHLTLNCRHFTRVGKEATRWKSSLLMQKTHGTI